VKLDGRQKNSQLTKLVITVGGENIL
jgi:hypothetical protein